MTGSGKRDLEKQERKMDREIQHQDEQIRAEDERRALEDAEGWFSVPGCKMKAGDCRLSRF